MKHLLPAVPKYFKANLHTPTNVSNSKHTPEYVDVKSTPARSIDIITNFLYCKRISSEDM